MLSANLSAIFYLISGVLFILALRGLSSPETSRQGNFFGILGMIIAITVTFLSIGNFSTGFVVVLIFLLIGGLIGAFIAYKIPMTAMPELVAGFHSLVGLAAVFVVLFYSFTSNSDHGDDPPSHKAEQPHQCSLCAGRRNRCCAWGRLQDEKRVSHKSS